MLPECDYVCLTATAKRCAHNHRQTDVIGILAYVYVHDYHTRWPTEPRNSNPIRANEMAAERTRHGAN